MNGFLGKIKGLFSEGGILGGLHGLFAGTSPAPPNTYILDDLSVQAEFAWSTYQLSSAQSTCVRIRRDGDNAEQDFDYVGGYWDTTSIDTFISGGGGSRGFIVTKYDSSGNGNDATESTTSDQREYISSGGVDNQAASFTNTTLVTNTYPFTTAISGISTAHSFDVYKSSSVVTGGEQCWIETTGNRYVQVNRNSDFRATPLGTVLRSLINYAANTDYLIDYPWDGTNFNFNINNVAGTTRAASGTMGNIVALYNSVELYCVQAHIFFPEDLGTTDRGLLIDWYNTNFNKAI